MVKNAESTIYNIESDREISENKKCSITWKLTSDGKTFSETQYVSSISEAREMLKRYKDYRITVHNIWKYGLGEISTDRKMIYSKSKGWI